MFTPLYTICAVVCLGKLKHYVSHTAKSTLSLACIHTHVTFHSRRIGRFLRAAGPTGQNVWTNLKHTRRHTFGTFSSHNVDFIFPSSAVLSAPRPSEAAAACSVLSGSSVARFQGLVMSTQGRAPLKKLRKVGKARYSVTLSNLHQCRLFAAIKTFLKKTFVCLQSRIVTWLFHLWV